MRPLTCSRLRAVLVGALALAAVGAAPHVPLTAKDRSRLFDSKLQMIIARSMASIGKPELGMEKMQKELAFRRQLVGERHPEYAYALGELATLHEMTGEFGRALAARQEQERILRATVLPTDLRYAQCLDRLASLQGQMGRFRDAEADFLRSLAIRRQVLGPRDSLVGASLNNLALLYKEMGRLADAGKLLHQARDISRQREGEDSLDFAHHTHNLALVYHAAGDLARAEPLYRQARPIYARRGQPNGQEVFTCLVNLAGLYHEMGDHSRALELFEEARAMGKGWAREPSRQAYLLNNLAMLYLSMGRTGDALKTMQQATDLRQKMLGRAHPDYALSLHNLAAIHEALGEYDRAESLLQQAQRIRRASVGEQHPFYANGLVKLAEVARHAGRLAQAVTLFEEASAIYRSLGGDEHPTLASCYQALASIYWQRRDLGQAEQLARRALLVARAHLERTAGVQSERQQLDQTAQLRLHLDRYLSLSAEAGTSADRVYPHLLAWKGIVSARQASLRIQAGGDDKAAALLNQLNDVSRRLASLLQAVPPRNQVEAYRAAVGKLGRRVEELEQALAEHSTSFARERQARQLTAAELARSLPDNVALVDLLEYDRLAPPSGPRQPWRVRPSLLAFVVRPGRPVARVELGGQEEIARAVTAWRQGVVAGSPGPAAADELARRLWRPLAPHLAGVRTLLVSPDGMAGSVPFAALPGSKPGMFLIEEFAVASVPVPRQLPALLAARPPARPPALLLVGDVDFDTRLGTSAPGSATAPRPRAVATRWVSLPGTQGEFETIQASFRAHFPQGQIARLGQAKASEAAVRRLAPGQRYLHFATHGYFASSGLRSALASRSSPGESRPVGYHPGLLSGLVLAGANRPIDPDQDDGILTAREVADLHLADCDLAVLSACETGLGEQVAGEGLLGLQRAFQVAGARSVVASLWKVPDGATRVLMGRFYDNLWAGKMSKTEALRQAQLWLLRQGARHPDVVRGVSNPKTGTGRTAPAADSGKLPPFFWAAWAVSGDWR